MDRSDGQYWTLLERLGRATTVDRLRDDTLAAFAHCGFPAAYFLSPVVADPRVARVLTNAGFPDAWERLYRTDNARCDPLPRIALARRRTFAWPANLPRAELSEEEAQYLARIADFGMDRGVAIPCFGPYARCGFVGVGLPDQDARFDAETLIRVEVAAQVSFRCYSRLVAPWTEAVADLSAREAEVIGLLAQGKSNSVIAQLVGVSPSSVDVYVKRLFAKLGVTDRTSASVKALALGLIVAGDWPGSEA